MSVEGLWSLLVRVPHGVVRPGGVTVFETDRVFGGDFAFFWTGKYTMGADMRLKADVRVQQFNFAPGIDSVFGIGMNDYELDVVSEPFKAGTIAAVARLKANPAMAIMLDFTKRADLP